MGPIELWLTIHATKRDIPWSWVSISKLALDFLLLVTSGAEFSFAIWLNANIDDGHVQLADLIGPVVKVLTFSLDFGLIYIGKRSGNKVLKFKIYKLIPQNLF